MRIRGRISPSPPSICTGDASTIRWPRSRWRCSLNPNFSLALGYYGLVLSAVGRWQEGADAARRALRLSPRDPFSAIFSGVAAYAEFVGRNYEEAVRLAREGIRQRPEFVGGYRILTAAAAMAGDGELARSALQELRRTQPDISLAWVESQMLVKEPAERAHYLEAFRRAGLDSSSSSDSAKCCSSATLRQSSCVLPVP